MNAERAERALRSNVFQHLTQEMRMVRAKTRVFFAVFALCALIAAVAAQSKPVDFKGLQMTAERVERAASASLKDCPPGSNTVNARTTKPDEEFAVVTVKFKVTPAFQ